MPTKLAFASLLLFAQSSHAITGNDALQAFTGSPQKLEYLQLYAKGLSDAEVAVKINADAAYKAGAKVVIPFCPPQGSTPLQAAMIIENHLRKTPESNHLDLYFVARRALVNAWQCPGYEQAIKEN